MIGWRCVYCGQWSAKDFETVGARRYRVCFTCRYCLHGCRAECLPDRADYLLARLRAEWVKVKSGKAAKFSAELLRHKGEAVKRQRFLGLSAARCRCSKCQPEFPALQWDKI